MSEPLYQLTGRYAELLDLAEQGEDVGEALAALDDAIEAKALNIVKLLVTLDANAEAAGAEERRLAGRRRSFESAGDRLRAYIKSCMEASSVTRIKSPQFSIVLSAGQPRVEILDLDAVPDPLVRTKTAREADKPAILKLHKDTGEIPPGVDIVATTKLTVR